jgi:hypothetical protein
MVAPGMGCSHSFAEEATTENTEKNGNAILHGSLRYHRGSEFMELENV